MQRYGGEWKRCLVQAMSVLQGVQRYWPYEGVGCPLSTKKRFISPE